MGANRLNPRNTARLARQTGLDVVRAWAFGGSDHTLTLLLRDGTAVELQNDGTIQPIPIESVPR